MIQPLISLKTTISLIQADVPIQRTLSRHINLQNFTPKEISKIQQPPPQLSTSAYTVDHINYNSQSTLTAVTQHLNSSLKKKKKWKENNRKKLTRWWRAQTEQWPHNHWDIHLP